MKTLQFPLFHHDPAGGFLPGAQDEIFMEILADGTIRLETDPISGANHAAAEGMLRRIAELAGGATSRVRKRIIRSITKLHQHQHVKD